VNQTSITECDMFSETDVSFLHNCVSLKQQFPQYLSDSLAFLTLKSTCTKKSFAFSYEHLPGDRRRSLELRFCISAGLVDLSLTLEGSVISFNDRILKD